MLKDELAQRQAANPSYSARAFARDIGLSPAHLSQIFHGVRGLSSPLAAKVSAQMGWNLARQRLFVRSASLSRVASAQEGLAADEQRELALSMPIKAIKEDHFRAISDWYHFALLELTKLSRFIFNEATLSSKLKISPQDAASALARLKRLGLLAFQNGQWVSTVSDYKVDEIPSAAIRRFHRQMLSKASSALDHQAVTDRYFSGTCLAFPKRRLPDAVKLIEEFQRQLLRLADGDELDSVYHFAIQAFRLDSPSDNA